MGGETLGPEETRCPSVGKCQDREAGVVVLVSRVRGKIGIFDGKSGKQIIYKTYIKKISNRKKRKAEGKE